MHELQWLKELFDFIKLEEQKPVVGSTHLDMQYQLDIFDIVIFERCLNKDLWYGRWSQFKTILHKIKQDNK